MKRNSEVATAYHQAARCGCSRGRSRHTQNGSLDSGRSADGPLEQGWSPKCHTESSQSSNVLGVIKTTAVQALNFFELENKALPPVLIPRPELEIKPGDILITRAGPRSRVGICCLVRSVRPRLILCDKVYRFRADETRILPAYFEYALNTPHMMDTLDFLKTGTSDSGVNLTQTKFLDLRINVPSLNEQAEIVRRVESLLVLASAIEARLVKAEKITNKLTQSILGKAFRGELVPTEAELARREGREYEPASALLDRIREAAKPKSTRRPERQPRKPKMKVAIARGQA